MLGRDELRTAADASSTRTLDRLRTPQLQVHPLRRACHPWLISTTGSQTS
ncbi:MAG: hypothetical protein ACRDR6_24155 [Pseudonocardiaceae bacterium]